MGSNGSGKALLTRLLTLDARPSSGRYRLFGDDTSAVDGDAAAPFLRRIGILWRDLPLLEHLSVIDNVALALQAIGKEPEQCRSDLDAVIDWVGLDGLASVHPPELSTGQRRRVALARAVVGAPELILAVSPTARLQPSDAGELFRLLRDMNGLGRTILVMSADPAVPPLLHDVPELHRHRLEAGKLTSEPGPT